MNIALVYTSKTGNTKELMDILCNLFREHHQQQVQLYHINSFPLTSLDDYDAMIVGTYTWGSGDIPKEMTPLYHAFEQQNVKHLITGVVGTGDRFYPNFCGAVDEFRDMLFVHTNLAVTLKVELTPQTQDLERCEKFVKLMLKRLQEK